MVAFSVCVVVAAFWWTRHHLAAGESAAAPGGGVAFSAGSLRLGGFFLGSGLLFYLVAIVTGCFSFSFKRPVWKAAKVKLYFANIVLIVLLGLGLGFLCAAFGGPVLLRLGLDVQTARLLPVMFMIVVVQMVLLWVLLWSPLEKRIIRKRLRTAGVSRAEVHSAMLVGLSNPGSGFAKRFGMIEEDLGGLWLTPELLIYRGDGEQFGITRGQLVQMERRADHRSTSVLGGIAHVILHVSLPDGSVRPIRLHTEGHWTMGRKRAAMEALAGAIAKWHAQRQFAYIAKPLKIPKF